MKEAEDYHHYVVVDQADWSAIDQLLALRKITRETVPLEEFMRQRSQYAHGNSGVPIVGDPDHIARQLIDLSRAGLTGIAVSLVNYADELPYFRDEVLPRLEKAGLRVPA
jgi:alkanesulfonate monooxygenase SsuD/methylene tetrahydromethanopterin reductase-like flavin-dependent oxidoreductase (luciferase family)